MSEPVPEVSPPTDDLQSLSDEEFMAAWTEHGDKVTEARERLLEFVADHDRRLQVAQLEKLMGTVDQTQKDNLIAAINSMPVGIESQEVVGGGDE